MIKYQINITYKDDYDNHKTDNIVNTNDIISKHILDKYRNKHIQVIIEEGITTIGNAAFENYIYSINI